MTAAPVLVLRAAVPATPATCLRPNARAHYLTRSDAVRALRCAARAAAEDALRGDGFAPVPADGPLWIDLTICWETGRKVQDWDGACSSSKAAIDGVFDALGADDKRVRGVAIDQVTTGERQGVTLVAVYAGPAPWGGGAATEGNEA